MGSFLHGFTFQTSHTETVLKKMRQIHGHQNDPFVNYYLNQARGQQQIGNGLPFFSGLKVQKGHGLGQIFSNIFSKVRSALPWFFKTVGKQALKSAIDVGSDVLDGRQKPLESLKQHGLSGLKAVGAEVAPKILQGLKESITRKDPGPIKEEESGEMVQTGSGKRRKKRKTTTSNKKRKRVCCRKDIFD